MSNLTSARMTYAELADVLDDMARRVRDGDSWEGNIEYLMPDPEEAADAAAAGLVEVRGVYRTGNTAGQGGMRMVGSLPVRR